jgi:hypothetical protein
MDSHSSTSSSMVSAVAMNMGAAALGMSAFRHLISPIDSAASLLRRISVISDIVVESVGGQSNTGVTQISVGQSVQELWETYLASITYPIGLFPSDRVMSLVSVWKFASEQLDAKCPIPITQTTSEDTLQFSWDNSHKYIDVETTRDGEFYWYFRDRSSGEVRGTSDSPIRDLGSDFFESLLAVVSEQVDTSIRPGRVRKT